MSAFEQGDICQQMNAGSKIRSVRVLSVSEDGTTAVVQARFGILRNVAYEVETAKLVRQ